MHGASVTASQRAGLVDWLVEVIFAITMYFLIILQLLGFTHMRVSQVSSYLNLSDITLNFAVSLFDRTLAVVEVEEEQLQITAITCLHLAAKVWMTSFESVQSVRSS